MKNDQANNFVETPESSSSEHAVRVAKVQAMRVAGIDPWPAFKEVSNTCREVIELFKDDQESATYTVAGRLMTFREHGKTAFATIQDRSGTLQIYLRRDILGDAKFDQLLQFVDIGDLLWFSGPSFRTKTGEITIKAHDVVLLSKCLYPLPEKFHGLADIETVYRQRYLDLITNQVSRERFKKRSALIRTMRDVFNEYGFMEVETPMLHPIPGGAAARPFVTHHNALDIDLYLRIAPELYLKRLVVGGFERVFEINRNFRNEGISTRHNPEFTMVEFYIAHQDYHFMMDFVEKMLREMVMTACQTLHIPFHGKMLDFESPFKRLTVKQAVMGYTSYSEEDLSPENIDKIFNEHGITLENTEAGWGYKLFVLFEKFAEPQLFQPTFVTDYPIEISPLTKRDPNNKDFVPRFELFIGGMEVSNGFNELNDPFDQAERFHQQARAHAAGDSEAHHYDADFILALEHGMPPTVGCGIGVDRIVMLVTEAPSIKDVILFPTLKPKQHE